MEELKVADTMANMHRIQLSLVVCMALIGGFFVHTERARSAAPATSTSPAASKPTGVPKFRCDQPVYELPHTWASDKVEHVFIVQNDGDAPLEITHIESACGCFVANEYTKTIAPGGSGRIPVSLVTAPQSLEVHKEMSVQTNDPAHADNLLTIQGKLVPRIKLEPIFGASWGRFLPGSPDFKVVKLTSNKPEPMKLEIVDSPEKSPFSGKIKELEPGKTAELVVTFEKPMKEGHHAGQLKLKTGFADEPELIIPCTILIPPALEVVPIAFSPMNAQQPEDRQTLMIRYNGENTMRILSADSTDDMVKRTLITKEAGRVYNLVVVIPPSYKPDDQKPLQIKIKTDVKEYADFAIPIRARAIASQPTTTTATSPN